MFECCCALIVVIDMDFLLWTCCTPKWNLEFFFRLELRARQALNCPTSYICDLTVSLSPIVSFFFVLLSETSSKF